MNPIHPSVALLNETTCELAVVCPAPERGTRCAGRCVLLVCAVYRLFVLLQSYFQKPFGVEELSLTDTIPSEAEGTPILREGLGTVRYLWAAEGSWHLGNDGRFECRNDGETCGNLNRSPGGTLEKGPNSYQAGSPRHHCSAQPHHGLL